MKRSKRQMIRRGIILASFLLFPVTIFYFSPYIIMMGAFNGIIAGSAIAFMLQLFFAIFLRRAFCGWVCPAGGLQETVSDVTGKQCNLRRGKLLKWIIWIPWLASIIAGFIVAGGVSGVEPLYFISGGMSVTSFEALCIYLAIVALFSILCAFLGRRAACHSICWMAPFMIIGSKIGQILHTPQLHVKANPNACASCGKCTKACPMSLQVEELISNGAITSADCIQCGACCDACNKDVLKLHFSSL